MFCRLEVDGQGHGLGPRDRGVISALVVRAGDPISTEALARRPVERASSLRRRRRSSRDASSRLRKRLGAAAIESGAAGYRLTVNEAEVSDRHFEQLFVPWTDRKPGLFGGNGDVRRA